MIFEKKKIFVIWIFKGRFFSDEEKINLLPDEYGEIQIEFSKVNKGAQGKKKY